MGLRLPPHLFAELPCVVYLRCHNPRSRPKDLRGEWITGGRVYAAHYEAGGLLVRLHGRHAEPPYRLLPAWRFTEVAQAWLN